MSQQSPVICSHNRFSQQRERLEATARPVSAGGTSVSRFLHGVALVICGVLTTPSLCVAQPGFTVGDFFFDDFEDGSYSDGNPVRWTTGVFNAERARIVGGSLMIEGATGPSVLGLRNDDSTAWLSYEDAILQTQVRITDPTLESFAVGFFTRSLSEDVYTAGITANGDIEITRTVGGSTIDLGRIATSLDPVANDVLLELSQIGTQFNLTAWELGMEKPDAPQLTAIDDTFAAGTLGPFLSSNGTPADAAFRFFGVSQVPEPTTLHLLTSCFAALHFCRRRVGPTFLQTRERI